MKTPTERFVDALCEALPYLSDEQRVRLEDAFADAVDARVEALLANSERHEEY